LSMPRDRGESLARSGTFERISERTISERTISDRMKRGSGSRSGGSRSRIKASSLSLRRLSRDKPPPAPPTPPPPPAMSMPRSRISPPYMDRGGGGGGGGEGTRRLMGGGDGSRRISRMSGRFLMALDLSMSRSGCDPSFEKELSLCRSPGCGAWSQADDRPRGSQFLVASPPTRGDDGIGGPSLLPIQCPGLSLLRCHRTS